MSIVTVLLGPPDDMSVGTSLPAVDGSVHAHSCSCPGSHLLCPSKLLLSLASPRKSPSPCQYLASLTPALRSPFFPPQPISAPFLLLLAFLFCPTLLPSSTFILCLRLLLPSSPALLPHLNLLLTPLLLSPTLLPHMGPLLLASPPSFLSPPLYYPFLPPSSTLSLLSLWALLCPHTPLSSSLCPYLLSPLFLHTLLSPSRPPYPSQSSSASETPSALLLCTHFSFPSALYLYLPTPSPTLPLQLPPPLPSLLLSPLQPALLFCVSPFSPQLASLAHVPVEVPSEHKLSGSMGFQRKKEFFSF